MISDHFFPHAEYRYIIVEMLPVFSHHIFIKHKKYTLRLFQRNETSSVGATNTGSTVSGRSVSNGKLTKVVTNHLGLDLDLVEGLTVVDTEDRADHLGNNDHVAQVSLDGGGLLVRSSGLRSGTELLDQTHGLAVKTTGESTASTGMDDLGELLSVELEEVGKVNATVGELLEGSLLTRICGAA